MLPTNFARDETRPRPPSGSAANMRTSRHLAGRTGVLDAPSTEARRRDPVMGRCERVRLRTWRRSTSEGTTVDMGWWRTSWWRTTSLPPSLPYPLGLQLRLHLHLNPHPQPESITSNPLLPLTLTSFTSASNLALHGRSPTAFLPVGMGLIRPPRRVEPPGWRGGSRLLGGWIVTVFVAPASSTNPCFAAPRGG